MATFLLSAMFPWVMFTSFTILYRTAHAETVIDDNNNNKTYESDHDLLWSRAAHSTSGQPSTSSNSISQSTLSFSSALLILLASGSFLALLAHRSRTAYIAFTALGPGGTPNTLGGFVKVQILSLFALANPCERLAVLETEKKGGQLTSLPRRRGVRPVTEGIAPHRQIDQKASVEVYERLLARLRAMSASGASKLKAGGLQFGTSCLDGHSAALFASHPPTRGNEICHCHAIDGSLHLILHPRDVNLVLEAAWGERHPLARGGWLERFVPSSFVLIYAPRDEGELEVVLRIVEAAGPWGRATGPAEDGLRDVVGIHVPG